MNVITTLRPPSNLKQKQLRTGDRPQVERVQPGMKGLRKASAGNSQRPTAVQGSSSMASNTSATYGESQTAVFGERVGAAHDVDGLPARPDPVLGLIPEVKRQLVPRPGRLHLRLHLPHPARPRVLVAALHALGRPGLGRAEVDAAAACRHAETVF